ncbi:MAG: carbohydrate-binding protein [Bacteroidales bacterium]|nr:carbohydrate-binding protein [Bacteroidales bacterium]
MFFICNIGCRNVCPCSYRIFFPSGLKPICRRFKIRAEKAWQWYKDNPRSANCDDGEIKAGDADRSLDDQDEAMVVAAVYLYALTGKAEYNESVINNYDITQPYDEVYWSMKSGEQGEALMYYVGLSNTDPEVKSNILNKRIDQGSSVEIYFNDDLYLSYMPSWAYWWGSNSTKNRIGISNYDYINYKIDSANHDRYFNHALGIVHYMHGVNPFAMVYLSNMYDYGAEKSLDEIYHSWFKDGTKWDNAVDSIGPAPGYIPGGPNMYDVTSQKVKVGNTVYNANVTDQPTLKKYTELNDGNNPWVYTEPAIYYQSPYIYLLSNFLNIGCDPALNIENVMIEQDTVSITEGYDFKVTATVYPLDYCIKFVGWQIEDTTIASVTTGGKITGKIAGITRIFVQSLADTTIKDTAVLVVLPCERKPFHESPAVIPGIIETEDYDIGCNDSYSDSDATNNGGKYRNDGVDIESCTEGGFNVGWTSEDEWLEYTVLVNKTSDYSILSRVASGSSAPGKFNISFNGKDETLTFDASLAGSTGWQDWKTIYQSGINLDSGEYIMRVYMEGSGYNLNYFRVLEGNISAPETPTELTAIKTNDYLASLSWNDQSDNETAFIVLRKTTGNFSVLKSLPANTTQFIDSSVVINKSYTYAVYAVDSLEIASERSNEVTLQIISGGDKAYFSSTLNIYPNPFDEEFVLEFASDERKNGELSFYDMTGRIIKKIEIEMIQGVNSIKISPGLQKGVYLLKFEQGINYHVKMIVIK